MRGLRWRSRENGWQIAYRLLVISLHALALLRNMALGAALLLHRAHTALAERGGVLVDTLGSTVDDDCDQEPDRDQNMPSPPVILLPAAARPAEEVRS